MIRRLCVALTAVSLIAASAPAAYLQIGTETPVGPPGHAGARSSVHVAITGTHRLVVWINAVDAEVDGDLDGKPVSILTIPPSERTVGGIAVAASADEFLVVWKGDASVDGVTVDVQGGIRRFEIAPLQAPAAGTVGDPAVVWNGDRFVVLWAEIENQPGAGSLRAAYVKDGQVTSTVKIAGVDGPNAVSIARLGPHVVGSVYTLEGGGTACDEAACNPAESSVDAFSLDGSVPTPPVRISQEEGSSAPALVAGDELVAIWWAAPSDLRLDGWDLRALRLDPMTGTPLVPSTMLSTASACSYLSPPRAVWNGGEFVILWEEVAGAACGVDVPWAIDLRMLRVSHALVPVGEIQTIASGVGDVPFDVAAAPEGGVALYSRVQNGVSQVFSRTIDRLPAPPLRRRTTR